MSGVAAPVPKTDDERAWWSAGFRAGVVARDRQILDAILPPAGTIEREERMAQLAAMASGMVGAAPGRVVAAEPAEMVADE